MEDVERVLGRLSYSAVALAGEGSARLDPRDMISVLDALGIAFGVQGLLRVDVSVRFGVTGEETPSVVSNRLPMHK